MRKRLPVLNRVSIVPLVLLATCQLAFGDTVSTSFEKFDTEVGEPFSIGSSPITATFSGDAFAGIAGIPELYRTGLKAWMGVPDGVARIDFETPASEVVFYARTRSTANDITVITAFDPDNNIVGSPETLVVGDPFRKITFTGNIDHILMENFATGTDHMNSIDDFSFTATVPSTVNADSVTVVFGEFVEGELSDTFLSDDVYLKYRRIQPISPTFPSIWLEFAATLPNDNPSTLKVILETQVNDTNITQNIEMFNYNSGQFEQVDSRQVSFNNDAVAEVELTGDVTRFVEMGTGAIKAKITYVSGIGGFGLAWRVCIDQLIWEFND